MEKTMVIYDTVKQYSQTFNNSALHPLISLVDLGKSTPLPRVKFKMGIYAIILKESKCGDLRYGNTYYDYDEGTIVFFAPEQIITTEPEGEIHQPFGTALVFHPDLIKGTSLGRQIHEFSYFSYQSNEALHVSEREKETIMNCIENISTEINQNIDRHSKKLIIANLELLLKYFSRFYDRQFITREEIHQGILLQFDQLLTDYIYGKDLTTKGLPSVAYFADCLHLSANYFGDLIKKETGKTALEYIQLKLLDFAKERVLDTTKSLSEISYELGFKYPQHFTRFFKQKLGVTPLEYRLN
ncbi:helix-turn-helix domain-containing protein [Flectobacillus roseus]|uniref:Helix-turn-helix transcriptional regulator n=1 Tax=Flectobacillus roseus TaxID=502259 RepID=A0ABT6YDQ0_9BACT|nr:helix-turn-helix transcriptional regulator [Flectobacillus roseus]MDI9861675.1 helix-turn-helix transcriptional regulator [Flectobacillus roseus]